MIYNLEVPWSRLSLLSYKNWYKIYFPIFAGRAGGCMNVMLDLWIPAFAFAAEANGEVTLDRRLILSPISSSTSRISGIQPINHFLVEEYTWDKGHHVISKEANVQRYERWIKQHSLLSSLWKYWKQTLRGQVEIANVQQYEPLTFVLLCCDFCVYCLLWR